MIAAADPDDRAPQDASAGETSHLIRVERRSLIELLEQLTAEEWETRSMCGAWTVQDVAAHLAWAPVLGPAEAVAGLVRAGFRLNTFIADSATRWSRRGRDAILDQLRDNAATGVTPLGVPAAAALTDAIVHGFDIRRPLGRPRPVPPQAFVEVAGWNARQRWPMTISVGGSARRRTRGVRLVADGLDWSHGTGPEVRGSGEALLLLLTGRRVEASELTGPGVRRLGLQA